MRKLVFASACVAAISLGGIGLALAQGATPSGAFGTTPSVSGSPSTDGSMAKTHKSKTYDAMAKMKKKKAKKGKAKSGTTTGGTKY